MTRLRPTLLTEPELNFAQVGRAWAFECRLTEADSPVPVVPASATITVTDNAGGALSPAVAGAAMTVSGSFVRYTLAAASLPADPSRAYRAVLSVVDDEGTTWDYLHLFDVVDFPPTMPAAVSDVAAGVPGMSNLAPPEDPDHSAVLREAWEDVLRFVQQLAQYPDLVLQRDQLKRGHVLRTRALVYGNVMREAGDAYATQHERWSGEWREWKDNVRLYVDANASGGLEGDELDPLNPQSVPFGRAEVGTRGFNRTVN